MVFHRISFFLHTIGHKLFKYQGNTTKECIIYALIHVLLEELQNKPTNLCTVAYETLEYL